MTAALSRIEDVDMAGEMTEYTKDNVLTPVSYTHLDVYKRQAYLHPNVMDKAIEKYCKKKILRNSERGKDYGESYG